MNWCFFGLPAGKVRNPHESVFYEVVFQCFLDRVPFPLTLRLWDIYMLEGDKILIAMSFNLMKMHRSKCSCWKSSLASSGGMWKPKVGHFNTHDISSLFSLTSDLFDLEKSETLWLNYLKSLLKPTLCVHGPTCNQKGQIACLF